MLSWIIVPMQMALSLQYRFQVHQDEGKRFVSAHGRVGSTPTYLSAGCILGFVRACYVPDVDPTIIGAADEEVGWNPHAGPDLCGPVLMTLELAFQGVACRPYLSLCHGVAHTVCSLCGQICPFSALSWGKWRHLQHYCMMR